VQTVNISTKSTAPFLSNSCLKMELKNRSFQYGKVTLAIPSVTVCAYQASGRHLHRHLHVSCAGRSLPDFLSADPVASICRRSQSIAEQDQSLSGNSSNNFLAL